MKFRTATIWIALVSTGMLCLAVGAVRIPRKPKSSQEQGQPSDSTQKMKEEPAPASVIPMRVAQPDDQAAPSKFILRNQAFTASTARSQPAQPQAASQQSYQPPSNYSNLPEVNSNAATRFGATGQYVTAQTANAPGNHPGGYQEPERWPFHRSPNASSTTSVSTSGAQQFPTTQQRHTASNSGIADWPYQPSNS